MSDLIPVLPHRPAVLPHAGGIIFLSVHDAAYLREQASWKRQLMAAHPDRQWPRTRTYRGGTTGQQRYGSIERFAKTLKAYKLWHAQENAWYGALGLTPPRTR